MLKTRLPWLNSGALGFLMTFTVTDTSAKMLGSLVRTAWIRTYKIIRQYKVSVIYQVLH